jgi:hypothetical protein
MRAIAADCRFKTVGASVLKMNFVRSAAPSLRQAWLGAACAVVLGGIANAQTPPAGPAKPGLQADFDAASDAASAGHCDEADPIFARLMVDPRVKPGSLPAAMVLVRRGVCRHFGADREQGDAWIRAGLPVVEAAGPSMAIDAYDGWNTLARDAQVNLDHDGAVFAFNRALAVPGMATRIDALTGLADVTAFDGDGVALAAIDRALAALAQRKDTAADRHKQEAYVRAIRVRVMMNQGRYAEADKEAETAVNLAGGLTSHISTSDVELRSDAAEAALLSGHEDRARELLAYTGAGRIAESPFALATSMRLPDCYDSVGLRTSDSAVVEFAINSDGTVAGAQTMFTRGNYATARIFAEAVRQWVWQPEKVAKLPLFYRALIRVELRCSRTGGGLPGVWSPFAKRIYAWVGSTSWMAGGLSDAGRAAALRQRAVVVETGGDRTGAAVLLMAALNTDPIFRPTSLSDADKAIALLADADPAHRASALAIRAKLLLQQENNQPSAAVQHRPAANTILFDAARDATVASDALAQDTLLMAGLARHRPGAFTASDMTMLNQVANDTRLGEGSPLRQIALLRLASRAAQDHHLDDAQALFTRTGLDAEQCSLIGDIPRRRTTESDSDFPTDALRMGFEGWVKEEYDISADGHTTEPRAVIAYPPFVFINGATKMVRNFRYDPSFRPLGKLACSAKDETITFAIPANH